MNAVKRLLWWLLAGSVGGINREERTLHLRWMTPNEVGWAHCKIILPENRL